MSSAPTDPSTLSTAVFAVVSLASIWLIRHAPKSDIDEDDVFCDPPIYYFGFGAMANSISRKRRGITSRGEVAAYLPDWKLMFVYGGAATVTPHTGATVHGVLMELTKKGWDIIRDFEKGYDVIQAPVVPYTRMISAEDGEGHKIQEQSPVSANMFRFPEASEAEQHAPEERYLKVIAMGMREAGVEEAYISKEILGIKFIPSTKPENYKQFEPAVTPLPEISWAEYKSHCQEFPFTFVLGKKVLLFPKPVEHRFKIFMEHHLFGKGDCTWKLWMLLLEPDLPVCESKGELQDFHRRWAENQMLEMLTKTGIPKPKTVAILINEEAQDER